MTVAATFGGLQRQKINLMMHMFVAADIDDVVVITSYAPRCRSGFHWLEDIYIYIWCPSTTQDATFGEL